MQTLIVIPSRFGSTRFPGKPLHMIAGKTLLSRVIDIARAVCAARAGTQFVVATDDARIEAHAKDLGAPVAMTDPELPSGSDRALKAAEIAAPEAELILNLQGDAPFTPPEHVIAIIDAAKRSSFDVITPVVQLSWNDLDTVRAQKETSPFSGTSCVFHPSGEAYWFSKMILPAIRGEADLRLASNLSPVWRHIGLYCYKREALARFVALPKGHYETLEGLEQLRFLENGMRIEAVKVEATPFAMWGIDTPDDAKHAERLIAKHGEPNGRM